ARRAFVRMEAQALVVAEVAMLLDEVAAESVLRGHVLARAYEPETRVAEARAGLGIPAPPVAVADAFPHAAERRAVVDPARMREAHPGLAVGLRDVLDLDAADPVREIVILRASDRVREPLEAELGEACEELVLVLAAKGAPHPFPDDGFTLAARHHEDEPREPRMVQRRDGASGAGRGGRLAHAAKVDRPGGDAQVVRHAPVWRSGRSSDTMPRHDGPRSQARIQGRGVPRQRRGASAAHPRRVSPAPARVRAA